MMDQSESGYKSLPFPSKLIDPSPLAGFIKASIFACLKYFSPVFCGRAAAQHWCLGCRERRTPVFVLLCLPNPCQPSASCC